RNDGTGGPSGPPVPGIGVEAESLHRDDDVDDLALALRAELHGTGLEGEQGVVATAADVGAGVEVRAALTDDDLAGLDDLAAEALHAETLRVGVTTVAG